MRKTLAVVLPVLCVALLTACGQPSSSLINGSNATPIASATIQPTPVATKGAITSGHPCIAGTASDVRMGDLRVSHVGFGNLAYPAYQLPSDLDTSKPYKAPTGVIDPPNPAVNPNMDNGGYEFSVCNTSTSNSHVIVGVTVSISAFSAYSGVLNVWQGCDGFYQRPFGLAGTGCGGGSCVDEYLHATFDASATTGAHVTSEHKGTCNSVAGPGPGAAPLPISLGPGQMLTVNVGVTPPVAQGTYTLAFGLSYDIVASAPISTPPTLFDSAAVPWSGKNCTKATMVSQIPSDDTQNRYICAP